MKLRTPVAFKCKKLFNPCKKISQLFKFRFRKPICIKAFRPRRHQPEPTNTPKKKKISGLLSVFQSKGSRGMDRVSELRSFSEAGHHKAPFPSPLTPAYVRLSAAAKKEVSRKVDDVEDACRSFENYLIEMIVEEGKVTDLADVEELLYCWKNLNCPVFKDLVCRFYGELCKDLFSDNDDYTNSP